MALQENEQGRSWIPKRLRKIYHRLTGRTESAFTGLQSQPDAPVEQRELIQENAYFRDFSEIFTFISSRVKKDDSGVIYNDDNEPVCQIGRDSHPGSNYVEITFSSPKEGIFIEKMTDGSLQISAEHIPFLQSQEGLPPGLYAILSPQADAKGNAMQVALMDPEKLSELSKGKDSNSMRNVQIIFDARDFTPEEKQQALLQLARLKRHINSLLEMSKLPKLEE